METVLTRRDRERLMRRTAMLDAARAVFAEKGYQNATLDEVAARAEFGKGTLYNYFAGGKEEIFLAILDDIFDEFADLIKTAFSPSRAEAHPPREVFENFFNDCFAFFQREEDVFLLIVKEAHQMMLGDDESKCLYFRKQRDRIAHLLAVPIGRFMERGDLRSLPPIAVAHALLGNIEGVQTHLSMERLVCSEPSAALSSPRQAAAFLTTLLFDGLLSPVTVHPA
jgi:TetR/AcrR family transcriptional regulator, repressor of fatR-cypB operon